MKGKEFGTYLARFAGRATASGNHTEPPRRFPAEERRAVLRLGLFLLGHGLVCAVFIVWFQHRFGYRRLIVPLHLSLLVYLVSFWITGSILLLRRGSAGGGRHVQRLIAVAFGLMATFLTALYTADVVGNQLWGNNVQLVFILTFLPRLSPSLLHASGIPPAALILMAITVPAAMLTAYIYCSRVFCAGLMAIAFSKTFWSPFKSRWRACTLACLLLVYWTAYGALLWRTAHSVRPYWEGEPLVGLFKRPNLFGYDERRNQTAALDWQARAAYDTAQSFQRRNVVFIVVDSLRANHMGVYGYPRPTTPFLSSLMESGRLQKVTRAYATCPETCCAVLSTLSSKPFNDLSHYNFTVYDLLHDLGYRTVFCMADDWDRWYGYRRVLDHSIDFLHSGHETKRYASTDDRLILEGLEMQPGYSGVPTFFYLHLYSAHSLGAKRPEYAIWPETERDPNVMPSDAEPRRAAAINQYDNGVLQADAVIREIFALLESKGYLKDALVVITGDHGEGLGEHGEYFHIFYTGEECLQIPLMFYDFPEAPYANLEFATQIDIAPTVVARLGLTIPPVWTGRSLLDPVIKEYSYHTTWEHGVHRRVVYYRPGAGLLFKYRRNEYPNRPFDEEALYEVIQDPAETVNLLNDAPPELVGKLREQADKAFNVQSDEELLRRMFHYPQ